MKERAKAKKLDKRIILIESIIVVVLMIINSAFAISANLSNSEKPTPFEAEITIPKVTAANSKMLFMGTTFWGRRTRNAANNSELGVDYPFAELSSLERDKYQGWFANLECPVTSTEHTTYEEETLLEFNCLPDYLENAAKYWTAFSIATNHSDNWGEEGIAETKTNLENAGIQYFGHYRYDNATENCGIVVVPVKAMQENGVEWEFKMPFGFCSAHGVFGIPSEAALQNIKKFASFVPTIVMPHMGVEYQNQADNLRTRLFRKMIDYGADMVLGDHPHHIQNSESYNGHLIVYSMGNFMFDQQFDETVYGAAIDATAEFGLETDFDAWDEIGEKCLEKHGVCLNEIIASGLPKVQIKWKDYDFIATTTASTFQTRKGGDYEYNFVRNRLKWDQTIKGL